MTVKTEEQRGNYVAKAVWKWLQEQKSIEFVPWVTDPKSAKYDHDKAREQEIRKSILSDLERVIMDAAASA